MQNNKKINEKLSGKMVNITNLDREILIFDKDLSFITKNIIEYIIGKIKQKEIFAARNTKGILFLVLIFFFVKINAFYLYYNDYFVKSKK